VLDGREVNINAWSRDGRWVSGYLAMPSGETRGHVVIEVATGAARQLNDDSMGYSVGWLPDSRHVVYFTRSGGLVVQDVTTLAREVVRGDLPYPPDAINSIAIAPDGRTLYYAAREVQANIWMVRRSDAGDARR
jgi:hypothetical protein